MSYCVSHIIGIRAEGVFSGPVDMTALREQIVAVAQEVDPDGPIERSLDSALSKKLSATKGSWVVIAGVFNYYSWEDASRFSCALSDRLGTEITHLCLNEETNELRVQVFLGGKSLYDVPEHPVARVLRRIT